MSTDAVRVEIYRSFIEEGRAPMPADIARDLDLTIPAVAAALDELDRADVIALLPGTHLVWLAHPFAAAHSPFEVRAGDRRWDAICIWDALGILALLGVDGEVDTVCPDCGDELTISVEDGNPIATDLLVHFGVPAARWYEDVGYT